MVFDGFFHSIRGGIPISFMCGKREICELLSYERKDIQTDTGVIHRVRLLLNYTEKFKDKQTGYWFDPEKDFDPALPIPGGDGRIPWDELGTTVIYCFKSTDGQFDWRTGKIAELQTRIQTLNQSLLSIKKDSIVLRRVLESYKDPEKRKEEAFEGAEMLSAINRILRTVPSSMDDELSKIRKDLDMQKWVNQ